MNNYSEVLTQYGTDFADLNKYGQQNLSAQQVLANGGTVYLCRLLPENAKTEPKTEDTSAKEDDKRNSKK